jgi:hypothetical protein
MLEGFCFASLPVIILKPLKLAARNDGLRIGNAISFIRVTLAA